MITQDQARETILKLKKENGITYTDIAEMLNISRGHLSLFLNGKRNFKRNILYKLETQTKGE